MNTEDKPQSSVPAKGLSVVSDPPVQVQADKAWFPRVQVTEEWLGKTQVRLLRWVLPGVFLAAAAIQILKLLIRLAQ